MANNDLLIIATDDQQRLVFQLRIKSKRPPGSLATLDGDENTNTRRDTELFETESVLENLLLQSALETGEIVWKELDKEKAEDIFIASKFMQPKKSFSNRQSIQIGPDGVARVMNSSGRESLLHDTFRYSNVQNDTLIKTSPKERQSFGPTIKGSIFKQDSTVDLNNVRKSMAFE